MNLYESIYRHLVAFGNTPIGEKMWKRHKSEIAEYLTERGIKFKTRYVEKKKSGWYESESLSPFYILERVK